MIQFFDEGDPGRLDLLGGKCASLVALTAANLPVPPGFTITTAAYDRFLAHNGLARGISAQLAAMRWTDLSDVDATATRIRTWIESAELPLTLRHAIVAAHNDLRARFGGDMPVAVRSSATAEDLPTASFAGQQDTYLWLHGTDAVLKHVRRCWASLYTCRAILYRLRNAVPDNGLSMAVAVQRMVNARAAGVAITMNPTNGDRSKIAIDASYGLGETVVSGRVTPDNILLDKVTLATVSEIVGVKQVELVAAAGRLVEREVDADRRVRRCLSDAELHAVAALAKRAEKHFGCPQDVEWAIDADLPDGGNVLLLQSRPETVHSAGRAVPQTVVHSGLAGITQALLRAAT